MGHAVAICTPGGGACGLQDESAVRGRDVWPPSHPGATHLPGATQPPRGHTSEGRPKQLQHLPVSIVSGPQCCSVLMLLVAYAAWCLLVLQDIFNLLPNMNVEALSKALAGAAGGACMRCRGRPLGGMGVIQGPGRCSMGRRAQTG